MKMLVENLTTLTLIFVLLIPKIICNTLYVTNYIVVTRHN